MIEFSHKLPAMHVLGRNNGTYNNEELVIPGILTTEDAHLGLFLHDLQNIVRDDRRKIFIDGRVLTASNNWIRDFVHQIKAFKHWEYDLKSFIDFLMETQREDGCFYELIKQLDDVHWQYVNEDCRILYSEDNVALVRLELEADIEYLMVEGVLQVYRATGDAEWLFGYLENLEKGIRYITSDPKRWSAELGLVIRPYTIDTWDFTSAPGTGTDRRIHENEPMCAMHGDNSGVYQAMMQLAWIREKHGDTEQAAEWKQKARTLRENMFRYLWNGRFFVHQLPVNCPPLDDRENERLSLSNPYDINRGVTDTDQSRAVIETYMERRKTTDAFAEWFSIDPPYEKFGAYPAGKYVNGTVSPFTAGELAKAAFENGYESYGWDIIGRFIQMEKRDHTIYFLYSPDDQSAQPGGPSAWGAAALMNAVEEGLAGIRDLDCLYREIAFSPRFPVTHYTELRYLTGYECSGTYLDMRYVCRDEGMRYDIHADKLTVHAHILLPEGKKAAAVLVNGEKVPFTCSCVGSSRYADFTAAGEKIVSMEIWFA